MRWIAAIVVASSPAFAGTIDDSVADSRYLEAGRRLAKVVGRLEVRRADDVQAAGTCVLIAPRWALTAAHVLDGYQAGQVVTAEGRRRVAAVRRQKDYRADVFGEHDIAVLRLDEPFGEADFPGIGGEDQPGQTVEIAGFGMTGLLSVGYGAHDGLLRAGTARIDRHEGTLLVCPSRGAGTPRPICTAPGDSGGPVLAGGRIVGIASHVSKPSDGTPTRSRAGEESCHTRVALYRDWIAAVMAEDAVLAAAR